MKKKLQIFISSTYTDLIEERQAAVSAILKAGHIPAGMELFTSGDESQMVTIKRWIDESDAFMLILGGRYGSVEEITSLSYTELEYDYAVSTGKPHFAVVIDEKALDHKVKERGREIIESENVKELSAFRKKVLGKMSAFFSDERDIKLAVHETLGEYVDRGDLNGWVSGSEIPDIKSFTDQIEKLREQNQILTAENKSLTEQISSKSSSLVDEEDFANILNALKSTTLNVNIEKLIDSSNDLATILNRLNVSTKRKLTEKVKTDLLSILMKNAEELITGIANSYGMPKFSNFLFFNVLPKLQIYGLAQSNAVPGVAYRRFALNAKGSNFIRYMKDKVV